MNGMRVSEKAAPRWWTRGFLSAFYAIAGVFHLTKPEVFVQITPSWVPNPREVIIVTGMCEMAGAAGLLTGRWRSAAGIALAAYAVCVYPANVKHAIDDLSGAHTPSLGAWYHILRLALQPVIVWWCLLAGGVTNWPFRRNVGQNLEREIEK